TVTISAADNTGTLILSKYDSTDLFYVIIDSIETLTISARCVNPSLHECDKKLYLLIALMDWS
ncbi:MAG: hypothetical protein LUD29_02155, partial [Clostridia bacterium]|nr:hypothetical protein [Clostridia bacterium]